MRVATDSDEALASRVRRGDTGAFAALATRYWSAVHRIARNMLPDPSKAGEIVEETFLRALRSSEWFPRGAPFRVSLYRLAIVLSLVRRQPGPASPTKPGESDQAGRIREELEHVEGLDRAAFVLREIEQVASEEAADILRASPQAIRESVHRVYLTLATCRSGPGSFASRPGDSMRAGPGPAGS